MADETLLGPVNYEAVLADLERRKAALELMITIEAWDDTIARPW